MFFRTASFFSVFLFSFSILAQGLIQAGDYEEISSETGFSRLAINHDRISDFMEMLLDRTSFFVGHNLSNRLEGLYYADGSVKNINTNTAFSIGIRERIYDFNENISIFTEIGHNTSRNLNPTSFKGSDNGVSNIFSPRFSFFNLVSLVEFKTFENMNSFVGLNFNFPIVSNSPFKLRGDFGFQGGAGYNIFRRMWLEGLIKINNMNLYNNMGEKRDVSLAGVELRGRYTF